MIHDPKLYPLFKVFENPTLSKPVSYRHEEMYLIESKTFLVVPTYVFDHVELTIQTDSGTVIDPLRDILPLHSLAWSSSASPLFSIETKGF